MPDQPFRRLILFRHAKSDWPDGVADVDRPLAPRGQAAAPRMAAYLAGEGLLPEHVMVSPARRTRETWALLEPKLAGAAVETVPGIYEAPARRLLDAVHGAPSEAGTLMLVGHNPGLQDLARHLVGEGEKGALRDLAKKFPTAAVAVIDFSAATWAEVAAGQGRLERFVTPGRLGHGEDE
ncbi:MAG: histidine phosphatase family protein [Methylobacterium frigidaeris]